jgi:DNA-binding transcriptional ArsR family regulator
MPRKTVTSAELLDARKDLFDVSDIVNLPPERRKDYSRLAVDEFLRIHPEGTVVDQIVEATGLSRKTVSSHLEVLVTLRKAYKKEWGPRRVVYYPFSAAISPLARSVVEVEGQVFTIQEVQSQFGKFIYVQERGQDASGSTVPKGGIVIPHSGLGKLVAKLSEYVEG